MTSASYLVTGMTCAHCEGSIAREVGEIPGVTAAVASATAGTLTVTSSAPIDDAAVLAAVDEAGYAATRA